MTLGRIFPLHRRVLPGLAVALLLAGCASVPPPTALMARAEQQLDAARQAHAADFAPVDYGFATQRYQAAQAAVSAGKYDVATDMANESLADARLAQTRAELAAVRRQVKAQRAENTRLRQQLLKAPAAASTSGSTAGGLPSQVVLPQPTYPTHAASTPAPPASVPTHEPEAAR